MKMAVLLVLCVVWQRQKKIFPGAGHSHCTALHCSTRSFDLHCASATTVRARRRVELGVPQAARLGAVEGYRRFSWATEYKYRHSPAYRLWRALFLSSSCSGHPQFRYALKNAPDCRKRSTLPSWYPLDGASPVILAMLARPLLKCVANWRVSRSFSGLLMGRARLYLA